LVSVVSLLAGFFLLLPHDLEELAESSVAQQAMLSNVYFWTNGGYFDGPDETKPLLHTWSLAVEEQFYLGFPLLLIAARRFSKRTAVLSLLTLAVASFLLSVWDVRQSPLTAFFLLPSRMWELLLGALLVYCPEPCFLRRRWLEFGAWTGLASVLAGALLFDSATKFPGMAALLPCVGTFLIIYSNTPRLTSLGGLLARKQVVFIGLLSYSLYLWHWPILAYLRYCLGGVLPLTVRLVALVASLLLAVVSWRFVETPFRKGFRQTGTGMLALSALASAGLVITVSLWINQERGLPWRVPEEIRQLAAPMESFEHFGSSLQTVREKQLPILGEKDDLSRQQDYIVWGDSHAMVVGNLINSLAKEHGVWGVMAALGGTIPVLGVGVRGGASNLAKSLHGMKKLSNTYARIKSRM